MGAVEKGSIQMAQLLLDNGADVSAADEVHTLHQKINLMSFPFRNDVEIVVFHCGTLPCDFETSLERLR